MVELFAQAQACAFDFGEIGDKPVRLMRRAAQRDLALKRVAMHAAIKVPARRG